MIDPATVVEKNNPKRAFVLAGDIGGTNSRFALYDLRSGAHCERGDGQGGVQVFQKEYRNHLFSDFTKVVSQFLVDAGNILPITACFAVAGPVKENVVVLTNIEGWVIDGFELEKKLSIAKVKVINDFSGVGYGLLTLEDSECVVINQGVPKPEAPIICVGAGTGLGECYLSYNKSTVNGKNLGFYDVLSSEGGHADFPANDPLLVELRDFIMKKNNIIERISVERVVSGNGIASIYDFLKSKFVDQADKETALKFDNAPNHEKPVIVSEAAKNGKCPLADQAIDIFLGCYGCEVGNCALKWLPFGGIYIAGGLLPRFLDRIEKSNFKKNCFFKGRLSKLIAEIPIRVVTDGHIGLRGAKLVAARLLAELNTEQQHHHNPNHNENSGTQMHTQKHHPHQKNLTHSLLLVSGGILAGVLISFAFLRPAHK